MREVLEDFKQYLPDYLSAAGSANLFAELKQFPKNMDQRLYTRALKGEAAIFQGDGFDKVPVVNLPHSDVRPAKVMVISNTCDVSSENPRFTPPRLLYCPLLSFNRYAEQKLADGKNIPAAHLEDVRSQKISSMFFLPKSEDVPEDSIALLDRVNNCDLKVLPADVITARRLFTLSDYGFYLFLFKLSIHFTRIREGVVRSPA